MDRTYDVVVIGGGPNGLLSAAYLCKAGLKVLVLERRHEMGGGALTEEAIGVPRLRVNTHAYFMMMVDYAPAYKDLELETRYGLNHMYPALQCVMPFEDGRALCMYSDVEKTCDSIAQFSKKDADAYRVFAEKSERYMKAFIGPATYAQAVPALEQLPVLEATQIGREIGEYTTKSPKDVVDELFEDPHVKALLLHNICMWGLGPEQDGLGFLVPLYMDRMYKYRMLEGGTHTLAQALTKVVLENGGKLMTSVIPTRIIVENGVAKGVEVEDGRTFKATQAVLSTIDQHQTFLDLVGTENLDPDFVDSVKLWRWEHWGLLGVHLALEEAPQFRAAEENPDLNNALYYVLGYHRPDDFIRDYDRIGDGICDPGSGYYAVIPTVLDPSQSVDGKHVCSLYKMAPYELDGDAENWCSLRKKEEHARGCIEVMRKYVTNLNDGNIRSMYVSTPAEYAGKFLNMVRGSIKQGAYLPLQMGYMRPNEYCSTHRSPIQRLFMGGACTYPGGTILLANGYLAADAIAEDLNIPRWWEEPEMIKRAKENGLMR